MENENKVKNTDNSNKKLMLSADRPMACLNINHRCTGFDGGYCKMTKAKCFFQQTCA